MTKTLSETRIAKSEIRALIPHSGSMCLLDRVIRWDNCSIVCTTNTHCDPDNPLRRNGRLSAVHAFEYGAQAAAVHGGLCARAMHGAVPPGYLAALRDARLHTQRLDDISSPLQIFAKHLAGEGTNTVYECRISTENCLIAEGRVTIVQRK
jgi:predicted hotdog family 3-hydroxylacyl-ACP dehydratase